MSPAEVVAGQLEAYNARDIDSFMAFWAEDADIYSHPDTLLAKGHDDIRARHVLRFQEPDLHGHLLNRVVLGNHVIDTERVTRNFADGVGEVDVVAIYDVVEGRIAKAWFLMGTPQLRT